MQQKIYTSLKGAAMGMAEVIPGVSGGTIAFITGIYEKLLSSINAIGPGLWQTYKSGGSRAVSKVVDGEFLFFLLAGMAAGFVGGVLLITSLMETHPEPLWGFFFGLIIASCILIFKEIGHMDTRRWLALIAGIAIAWMVTIVTPAEGTLNPIYVFFSAMLAICALMLPGISGSFVLLLLGMYTLIIPKIKDFLTSPNLPDFIILSVFALGCLAGLFSFSKVLGWLFEKYKGTAFALLTGFMIGSLNKIWPWRNVTSILDKITGEHITSTTALDLAGLDKENYKILQEVKVFPDQYQMGDPKVILTIVAIIGGFAIVFLLDKYSAKGVNKI